jgi:hypothetical protein
VSSALFGNREDSFPEQKKRKYRKERKERKRDIEEKRKMNFFITKKKRNKQGELRIE